jgi:benzoyl-CoA reductase/2-hydroxyglutaryl-CoA dehydratase subunit BcrC/BadD/HgdB
MALAARATAFEVLQHHYVDRLASAREAIARGTGVVGRIGPTVPAELILAAGRLPIFVAADSGTPTPTAEIYMEPVIPPETKSLFEIAVSGSLEAFDLLVLSRPYAHLYYYLKEVHRMGRAPRLPPLQMHDLMQSQREAVRAYNWSQTRALLDRLEKLAGAPITDAALRAATAQTNRIRGLQRQLLLKRWTAELSGVDALQAIGAGYFMAPENYAAALEQCLQELPESPNLTGRPRLLVLPSEPLSHLHLHRTLEDAGALVVAEDDVWGSRAPGADVAPTGSALEGIFLKYWLDTPTSNVYPAETREAWFLAQLERPEVDGVVFYLPPSDHQLGWDYPRLKSVVEQRGKPSLLIRVDAADADGRETITQQVQTWLESRR